MYTNPPVRFEFLRGFLLGLAARIARVNYEFRQFPSTRHLKPARDPLSILPPSLSRAAGRPRRAKDIGINGLGRRYQLVSHHSGTSCSTWRSLHLSSLLSVHRGPSLPAVHDARIFRGTLSLVLSKLVSAR